MARVILVFNKKVIKEYPFSRDSMTIGRDEANEIVIDNLAVSGHHARIDKTGGIYILTDLQSTNGTFANDKKITSYKLQHKDKITIGKHNIRIK
jgi:pSer/pThr/pTyr-binding forkhead associated (FHA) protein